MLSVITIKSVPDSINLARENTYDRLPVTEIIYSTFKVFSLPSNIHNRVKRFKRLDLFQKSNDSRTLPSSIRSVRQYLLPSAFVLHIFLRNREVCRRWEDDCGSKELTWIIMPLFVHLRAFQAPERVIDKYFPCFLPIIALKFRSDLNKRLQKNGWKDFRSFPLKLLLSETCHYCNFHFFLHYYTFNYIYRNTKPSITEC